MNTEKGLINIKKGLINIEKGLIQKKSKRSIQKKDLQMHQSWNEVVAIIIILGITGCNWTHIINLYTYIHNNLCFMLQCYIIILHILHATQIILVHPKWAINWDSNIGLFFFVP